MTSAARTNKRGGGFTLLEIVIVLAVAAIITGGALSFMHYSSDERVLRDISGEVEVMAKRARTAAILQQTPYALEFRADGVRLMPLAETGELDRKTGLGNEIGGREVAEEGEEEKSEPIREELIYPDDMAVSVRRWNTVAWIPMTRDALQIWRFDPDGLCEPVSVRYTIDKGWAEDTYHPLTASIRDSQLEAR